MFTVNYSIANYSLTSTGWDFEPTQEDLVEWVIEQGKVLGVTDGELFTEIEGQTYGVPMSWIIEGGTGRSYLEAHLTIQ